VLDYVTRAIWDKGASLQGRELKLSGFVSPGKDGRAYLTRIVLSCCAADGRPLKVALSGAVPDGLAVDSWVEVVGTFDPAVDKDPASQEVVPYLRVTELRQIPAPKQPYEA
ncbi:MAG TPA: hypothetical protein VGR21_01960, partial [Cryptosporangiaceae bacterium]|nr:hypothetical protein [Cryptosporangiaceae bacterium]